MNFDNTQKELLNYLSNHKLFRIFLPLSTILLIAGQAILIIGLFGINLGIISTILTVLVYVGIVLSLAKGNYKILLIGLSLRIIYYVIQFIKGIMDPYTNVELSSIVYLIVWLYFTYCAYLKINKR